MSQEVTDIQRWLDEKPNSRGFCVIGKGKSVHLSRGNDESLCGKMMISAGSRYVDSTDVLDYNPCRTCWKIMERESAELEEGAHVAAKLKLSEVRGDVPVGSATGSNGTVHAIKDVDEKGRNVAYCPTKMKTPIRRWGLAMEQNPNLELCAACSKVVPTGDVEVTTTNVAIPGLGRTVPAKVVKPVDADTTNEKTEKDAMAAKATMTKAVQEEVAAQIRASIERLPSLIAEGKDDSAKELSEEISKEIPKITGTGAAALKAKLRAELTKADADAKKAKADAEKADKPAAKKAAAKKAAKPAKGAEVATRETKDPMKVVGIPELIAQGIELVKEVAANEFNGAYKIAQKIFAMRTNILDEQEDPDLGGRRQASKDAASLLWDGVLNALPPEGEDENADVIRDSIGQLKKQQRNAMIDVAVLYVRWLDTEEPKDENEAASLAVERAKFKKMTEAHPDLKPSEAIHKYYDDNNKPLPKKTRAETAKENRDRKALEKAKLEEAVKAGELSEEEAAATLSGGDEKEKTPKELRAAYVLRVTNSFKKQVKEIRAIENAEEQEEALDELTSLISDLRKALKAETKV
ncbi:hypothetical protein [Streptomyces violascens]|uniref:Uncharacterized protein n=1 Tax=Streptomyces violascens TaxID=67381 RepID=A0ABQ3QQT4_9ACTN|nr:hypothetical protein [Streptomyces violascens]GGU49130.1 hypothetical protein GCM10010289_82100 [Streptomyces violascens]GHI39636.1 hypothetical protein Sviol_40440 [Streptomyces violascens]